MNTGSLDVNCSTLEVVFGDTVVVTISKIAESVVVLIRVDGVVASVDVNNVDAVDVSHGFRRKYNFDKRFGDCDEKLFSSLR